ncbi:MAG: dihydrolipoamide acyltransferase [Acidimicrobiia bacterium]|nr:dihydrolipoamide acyltransferase [Acidimicrobiia bacterium]
MPVPVSIPNAKLSMQEGAIAKRLKAEGDPVILGESLFELEADKLLSEVESPACGALLRFAVLQGALQKRSHA